MLKIIAANAARIAEWVWGLVRYREPAAALGVVATLALTAQAEVAEAHDWRTAVPLLVSLLVRQAVYSPETRDEHEADGFSDGYSLGWEDAGRSR